MEGLSTLNCFALSKSLKPHAQTPGSWTPSSLLQHIFSAYIKNSKDSAISEPCESTVYHQLWTTKPLRLHTQQEKALLVCVRTKTHIFNLDRERSWSHLISAACSPVASLPFLKQALLSSSKSLWKSLPGTEPVSLLFVLNSHTTPAFGLPSAVTVPVLSPAPRSAATPASPPEASSLPVAFLLALNNSAHPCLIRHKWFSRPLMVEFGNKVHVIWVWTGNQTSSFRF